MTTKVQKWGNSYAVRLPKAMVDSLAIEKNSKVEITLRDNSIFIRPAEKKVTLKDLISKITKKNRHSAIDWGNTKGKEIW